MASIATIPLAALLLCGCYDLDVSTPQTGTDTDTDTDTDSDTGPAFDGDLEWVVQAGGGNSNNVGISVDAFSDGDLLVTGFHGDGAVFGPGEANETALYASPCHDMPIARYDRDGALEQARRIGAEPEEGTSFNHNEGYYLEILNDGSFVIVGNAQGTTPVIFGEGEANETALTPVTSWGKDLYAARFNDDGTLAWARMAGGNMADTAVSGFVPPDGDTLWIVGAFSTDATFGAGEANETVLSTDAFCFDGASGTTFFLAAYDLANGDLRWAKQALGCSTGMSISGAADSGYLLVTGRFEETMTLGEGADAVTLASAGGASPGGDDAFVARFDAEDGALAWAVSAGGGGLDRGTSIAELAGGSALVAGTFEGGATFTSASGGSETILEATGGEGFFTAVYTSDGGLASARTNGVGGEGAWSTDGGYPVLLALPGGDYMVGGQFVGSVVLGPGEPAEIGFESRGVTDLYLARFDPDGALRWARQEGGEVDDWFGNLVAPTEGTVVATGMFGGTVTFGTGEENETTLTAIGTTETVTGLDMFLMKVAIE